jgi:hypothetical protein
VTSRITATTAVWLALLAPSALAFGGPVDVSEGPAGAGGSGVAAAPGGGAAFAWTRTSDAHVVVRRMSPDGTRGDVVDVSGEGATATQPAIALAGADLVVGWVRPSDHHMVVRRLGADGALGPIWDVSNASLSELNGQAGVVANGGGRVAVAWRRPNDSHVSFRTFDVASGPSSGVVDLTSEPDIALFGTNVQVAIGDDGSAAVAWHRNTDCHIIVRRVDPAGNAAAQKDVSGQPDSAVGDTNPTVAIDDAGDAIAAWHRDSDHHPVTRRWALDDSLGAIDELGGETVSMANFGIAPLATSAAVAWQREADSHVIVTKDGVPVDVSQAAATTAPAAARTPDGWLVVAWRAADGSIAAAFEAGPPPQPRQDPPPPGVGGGGGGAGDAPPPGGTTPGTLPTTPPTTLPTDLVRLPGSATLRRGRVRLVLRCARACRGTVVLRAKGRVLGRARFALRAGERRAVVVRVGKRAKNVRRVRLVVRAEGAAPRATTLTLRR